MEGTTFEHDDPELLKAAREEKIRDLKAMIEDEESQIEWMTQDISDRETNVINWSLELERLESE